MTSYFENLVNSQYQNDLPKSAYLILWRYEDLNTESLSYFEKHQESNDKEMRDFYWKRSCELDNRAMGLLEAYEILTARDINATPYAVSKEMNWLNDTFDLGY